MKRFYFKNTEMRVERPNFTYYMDITSGKDVYFRRVYGGTMYKCDVLPMHHCLGICTPDGEQFTLRKRKGQIVLTDHATGVDLNLDRSIAK